MVGTGKTTLARKLRSRFSRVLTIDGLHEYDGVVCDSFSGVADYFLRPRPTFSVTLRPSCEEDVPYTLELAWEIGNVCVVLEEAEMYITQHFVMPELRDIISFGRHREISLIAIGRRVPELNIALRAQATSMITFAQIEPTDLDKLEQYGFNREKILSLRGHEMCAIGEPLAQSDGGEIRGNIVSVPEMQQ
jgi:hypothetical protein